jgi:predicted aspartyl protease
MAVRVAIWFLAVLCGFWLSVGARAQDPVTAALEAADPAAVEALLARPDRLTRGQAALLEGALAAMRFDDEGAVKSLTQALQAGPMDPATRRRTLGMLGGVHLRANDYAAAAQALDGALAAGDTSQTERDRFSLQQTRDVAHALRGETAQTHEPLRTGAAPIVRDVANLARAMGRVNGADQEFILDTGAGFSTITRSRAVKLNVRLLPDKITVGSATSHAVPAQLGVAESVEIAGNRFHHTVFLVMEDAALSFADGAYKIDAILGFPVLARLGRIEFARAGEREVFRAAVPSAGIGNHDLYLDTLRPLVVVDVAGGGRVRLLLDSGAKHSSLNGLFAKAYPKLLQNAARQSQKVGGAGGVQTVDVRVLPELTLVADGRARQIESVSVSDDDGDEHGALGQDVLRAEGGFALDFRTMDFIFLP